MSGVIRAPRLREPVVLLRSLQERPAPAHTVDAQVKAAPSAEPPAPKISYDEYKERFREDHLEDPHTCPNCGAKDSFTEGRAFNLMFKTFVGPVADDAAKLTPRRRVR